MNNARFQCVAAEAHAALELTRAVINEVGISWGADGAPDLWHPFTGELIYSSEPIYSTNGDACADYLRSIGMLLSWADKGVA